MVENIYRELGLRYGTEYKLSDEKELIIQFWLSQIYL